MNKDTDNKNMIYFLVISMAVLAIYQFFVFGPQQKKREAAMQAAAVASSSAAAKGLPLGGVSTTLTRDQALAASPRIIISTPSLQGSIALKGASNGDPRDTHIESRINIGLHGTHSVDARIH